MSNLTLTVEPLIDANEAGRVLKMQPVTRARERLI
jgi:hypothetical protein